MPSGDGDVGAQVGRLGPFQERHHAVCVTADQTTESADGGHLGAGGAVSGPPGDSVPFPATGVSRYVK